MMSEHNLLETGIFTVSDAADLVGATQAKVRGWIDGYPDREDAILDNDLGWLGDRLAFSFLNLMEIRFVSFFVNAGVKLRAIRAIMQEVRDTIAHPHPFATKTVFRTDGRKIVAAIAAKNGVTSVYDLRSKNYEMAVVVMDFLKDDVVYDPMGEAAIWRPRPAVAPNVIVHPKLSFGRPVLKQSRIPTSVLARAVKVEKSVRSVATIYDITERDVKEAVSFEDSLRRAA